jgi:thiamine-monophosphate kinase
VPDRPRQQAEFALIDRLVRDDAGADAGVVVGVGDDCAVLDVGGGELLLVTTDLMTEGVHFLRSADPKALGDKLMAVNLSDVAAMGGQPAHAVLAMAVPEDLDGGFLERLYDGLYACAERHGVTLVGGDTTASRGPLTLALTLTGRGDICRLLLRDGARPGDRVLVSGTLGDAAAGLALTLDDRVAGLSDEDRTHLLARHHRPEPRVALGRTLAGMEGVTAAIDLSDGLASDLGHICDRSSVGARVHMDQLPVSAALQRYCEATDADAAELALAGGEDYELCVTVRPDAVERARSAARGIGVPLRDVGEVCGGGERVRVDPDGTERPLVHIGFEHLQPPGRD